jgi:hypothetical protein
MTFDPQRPHPLGAFRAAPATRLTVKVRRFSMSERISFVVVALLVLAGAVVVVNIFPGKGQHDPIGLVVVLASFVAMGLVGATLLERDATLEITGDEIVIDRGIVGRFSRAGARLATWTMPDGTRRGSALILAGAVPFTLGGLGHTSRAAPTESVKSVDAYLSAEDFEALLAAAPVANPIAAADRLRCSLAAGPAGFAAVAPWLATIAIAAALAPAREALNGVLGEPGDGFAILMGAVLVAGLVTTVVLSLRRSLGPQAFLDVDARRLLVSNRAGRVLLEAPLHLVVARPFRRTYRGRMSFVMPVIALSAPGFAEVTLGVNELIAGWPERVPSCGSPRFVIGGADWAALLARLGQRPL